MIRSMRNQLKLGLAATFERTGLNAGLWRAQCRLCGPHIRVLNYHDVPPQLATAFERQLAAFSRAFVPAGPHELVDLLEGRWSAGRPGLLLTFDDGLRSHAEVVAPLLERYGFTGWFMVPWEFVDSEPEMQEQFARDHQILYDPSGWPDGRGAMTWEQARALARSHVVGCHTRSHRRLASTLPEVVLDDEVVTAKAELAARLEHDVTAFCWVGGEEWSYSREAAERVRAAGYKFGFMTNSLPITPGSDPLQLQRTNVEAGFPDELVGLSLSGVYDVLYAPKRRRVNRLTSSAVIGGA